MTKNIFIAGAKSDIGKAIAIKYASQGFGVYLGARQSIGLSDFASDLNIRHQVEVELIELDILDFESHSEIVNSISEKITGYICVIGYLGDNVKAGVDFDYAKKTIDTNFTGVVSLTNQFSNVFRKKGGFISVVSSVAGDRGRKSNYFYGASKAALTAYLSGLRGSLFPSGVSVLTIKPGFVYTKMTEGMNLPPLLTSSPEEVAKTVYRATEKGKNVIYVKWYWRFIMLIIKLIPERLFKKLNL